MDKMTFASYKFKPSDVIEGLNRYFAETKANRYRRVPLEIRNGEVKPGNYCVFRNIVSDVRAPKIKECGYYYLICDPEEVAGVAINWLREGYDIFYTPGMEVPGEDFDVDVAAKAYEKATRKDIFCEENLDVVPVARVKEALGIAEDSDIFQCIKYRNHQLETLRTELAAARRMHHLGIEERNQFGKRLADIRKAAGMKDDDPTDLVKYVETLREKTEEQQKKIDSYEATLGKITDIMKPEHAGPAWSETLDDLVERIKRIKEKVETLEEDNTDWRDSFTKAQDSRSAFCKKLKEALDVDYRYPSSFPKMEEDILWEIERLNGTSEDLRKQLESRYAKMDELKSIIKGVAEQRDNLLKFRSEVAEVSGIDLLCGLFDENTKKIIDAVKALKEFRKEVMKRAGVDESEMSDSYILRSLDIRLDHCAYDHFINKVYELAGCKMYSCSLDEVIYELKKKLKALDFRVDADLEADYARMSQNLDYLAELSQSRQTELSNLRYEILKVYREIFDCSDGDPEGTDKETLQDILTEYKRTLELKNVAEEKTIKWKERALENEEKAAKYKDATKENRVQWNNTKAQLQWGQEEKRKWLEKYEKLKSELNVMTKRYGGSVMTSGGLCEDLTKEREKVKRLEQKLVEIQDICDR